MVQQTIPARHFFHHRHRRSSDLSSSALVCTNRGVCQLSSEPWSPGLFRICRDPLVAGCRTI
jgi:hypothetical protein